MIKRKSNFDPVSDYVLMLKGGKPDKNKHLY